MKNRRYSIEIKGRDYRERERGKEKERQLLGRDITRSVKVREPTPGSRLLAYDRGTLLFILALSAQLVKKSSPPSVVVRRCDRYCAASSSRRTANFNTCAFLLSSLFVSFFLFFFLIDRQFFRLIAEQLRRFGTALRVTRGESRNGPPGWVFNAFWIGLLRAVKSVRV